MAERRILALGGHDFDRRDGNDSICDLIVELAEAPRARVCLLPTASGDPEDQISRFRRAFGERDTPLVPRRLEEARPPINDVRDEILEFRQTLAARAASRRGRRRHPGRLDWRG
jgi:peptidase E